MPPQSSSTRLLYETHKKDDSSEYTAPDTQPEKHDRKLEIVWRNVILFVLLHVGALYGSYLFFTAVMWKTFFFTIFLYWCSGLGITAGAHRLWSHKSYKAKAPLRLLLTLFNTLAFQNSVIEWSRDHRMHHKYSETDADPHNATRGFFFSHVGWLLCRKHPEIKAKGHNVDMEDLKSDPILRFQEKYYIPLFTLVCFVLPTLVPNFFWNETKFNSFFVCAVFRYTFVLNATWLVNSWAHLWGDKPYDENINPVEAMPVSFWALGEGFHNYHHTFPWDYKTAELGSYTLNFTKMFIDFMAMIGWAYDLKTVSEDIIEKRVKRTGDGSHPVWGWDDKDVTEDDKKATVVMNGWNSKGLPVGS